MRVTRNGEEGESSDAPRLREGQLAEVRRELGRILESSWFRTSHQCQNLLQYVVLQMLEGDNESLRERVIGAEVFKRSRDYDTAEDPVVRIRAADVRKRLAQYYQSSPDTGSKVRIDIPPGAYRASFDWVPEETSEAVPEKVAAPAQESRLEAPAGEELRAVIASIPDRAQKRFGWVPLVLLACLFAVTGLFFLNRRFNPPASADLFWAPVLANPKPAVVYLGSNAAYILSDEYIRRYRETHAVEHIGHEFFPDFPPDGTIATRDLVPVRNSFVTVGDVGATTVLVSALVRRGKAYEVRLGSDITIGDFRNAPAILIGGFNNDWVLKLTGDLRYVFQQGDRVVDQFDPKRVWVERKDAHGRPTDDYAVVTRLLNSTTDGPLLTAAGIGDTATVAAADFLTNSQQIANAMKKSPEDWSKRNVQLVLHVKVVDYTPSSVSVEAMYVW